MHIEITIPDQVYKEDPAYGPFFAAIQQMVNRMAMSHYKYGPIRDNAKLGEVHETKCALQRLSMYDPRFIEQEKIWDADAKAVDTGNTENLLDAANFLIIESIFPKHRQAHFNAQASHDSPGLSF